MLLRLLAALLLLLLVAASLTVRVHTIRRRRELGLGDMPQEPIPSPLSEALGQLLGTAGGIYLTLVMLVAFLNFNVPEQVTFMNVRVDPVALLAVFLALVQPFIPGLRR